MSREALFTDVQRVVLQRPQAAAVAHVLVDLGRDGCGNAFLAALRGEVAYGSRASGSVRGTELSLGLTRRGFESLGVPRALLGLMGRLAPAWAHGAKQRAAAFLGDTGASAPTFWEAGFASDRTGAVLTLHGETEQAVLDGIERVESIGRRAGVTVGPAHCGARLAPPPSRDPEQATGERQEWVHFGYRDGLSKVWVRGFPDDWHRPPPERSREHEAGEFVLGHANDHGANPWLLPSARPLVRSLFRHGSFGVLRKIEQDVLGFDAAVARWAKQLARERSDLSGDLEDLVRAKLCGRSPSGHLIEEGSRFSRGEPRDEFDHTRDPQGLACPLTSHIRRMNPRNEPWQAGRSSERTASGAEVAHVRNRTLIRRGMPYGPWSSGTPDQIPRGLLGHFFCSSIEAQFEHLVGQWAERSPLGVVGGGRAKDPLAGQHDDPAAAFQFTLGDQVHQLKGFTSFCTTKGTVYAFYPSAEGLRQLCEEDFVNPTDSLELTA